LPWLIREVFSIAVLFPMDRQVLACFDPWRPNLKIAVALVCFVNDFAM
jgi:hypothetical protein